MKKVKERKRMILNLPSSVWEDWAYKEHYESLFTFDDPELSYRYQQVYIENNGAL